MSKRTDEQAAKRAAFEGQTKKSAFSPSLQSGRSKLELLLSQGKNMDQVMGSFPGVSREEIQQFMQKNGLVFKNIKSASSKMGEWNKGKN